MYLSQTPETPETSKHPPFCPGVSVRVFPHPAACLCLYLARHGISHVTSTLLTIPCAHFSSLPFRIFVFLTHPSVSLHLGLFLQCGFSDPSTHTLSPSLVMQHGPDHHQDSKSHRHGWINSALDPTDHPHSGLFQSMVS